MRWSENWILPADATAPASVSDACTVLVDARARWRDRRAELRDAAAALEAAHQSDSAKIADATRSSTATPTKLEEPAALQRRDVAARALRAAEQQIDEAARAYTDTIRAERERWEPVQADAIALAVHEVEELFAALTAALEHLAVEVGVLEAVRRVTNNPLSVSFAPSQLQGRGARRTTASNIPRELLEGLGELVAAIGAQHAPVESTAA